MKKVIKGLVIFGLIIVSVFGTYHTKSVYAYTDEEKAQAKAWLSAHGYSPDYGGASQAYQDYLNGKFDEELGIVTPTEETTQEATTEEVTTEKQVTPPGPKKEKPGTPKKEDTNEKKENAQEVERTDVQNTKQEQETATEQDDTKKDVDVASDDLNGENDETMKMPADETQLWVEFERGIDYTKPYKRAAAAGAIVVVVIVLVAGVTLSKRKQKKDIK